jgi:16S rRNA (cytosine1402-N4)-methyltransferase
VSPPPDHIPVLLDEVLDCLSPRAGGVYVDGTFGAGGYTRAILDAAPCTVHAIDRDPDALALAREMALAYPNRLIVHDGCFGDMASLIAGPVDGIVLDIGVSSMQLDRAERGFSFRHDAPLDMRMSQSGQSAADFVNTLPEEDLANVIFRYGDERASRRIARRIVEARPLSTTGDLAKAVHAVLPMHGGMRTDTATRTFQAIRILVNDELGELERALDSAAGLIAPGGVLAVVTFHSLEDALVKGFFREASGVAPAVSRHVPVLDNTRVATFRPAKPKKAGDAECARNPRSRSATLRYGERVHA